MTLTDCIELLHRFYGLLASPPHDPFQLFVWEVLSSESPSKRDAAYAALKRARALTPDALRHAPQSTVALKLLDPYFEPRLSTLRNGADAFRRYQGMAAALSGPLRAARRAVKALPPLGDAGSHRMLLFAGDHPILPVDTRLHRVAIRLGYGTVDRRMRKSVRSVRGALARALPCDIDAYRRTFLYLSHHGASTCTEADPRCIVCPLLPDCPEGRKRTGSAVRSVTPEA